MNRGEKGTNIPDIERLMNVAYLGKVTVAYIFRLDDNRNGTNWARSCGRLSENP